MNKDHLTRIILFAIFILIIALFINTFQIHTSINKETDKLKKSILISDKLIKEADGRYSKLVNYYNSEKDLIKNIKEQNKELYKTIKKQDERLLSITNTLITLDEKIVKGFGKPDPIDTNKINFSLKYPDDINPFIFWDGSINKKTAAYSGKFSFSGLPLSIVLTEESRGLWKTRLIGPSWLRVDSLSVISIPPEKYVIATPKKIQWIVGGSYYAMLNSSTRAFGVNLGLNLLDRHNVIVGANTLQQINIGYLYKIKTFKRIK